MKKLILCLLVIVFGFRPQAQQANVEILLLGTQHQFKDSLLERQQFEKIREKLAAFMPEIICIESIPVSDTASLNEVRSGQMAVAKRLALSEGLNVNQSESRVDSLSSLLKADPNSLIVRSHLANQLYVNHDFWNAYYHYVTLARSLQRGQLPEDIEALQASFALDSIHERILKRERLTEYGKIVFPLAEDLGIHYLHNADYRADESEFLKRTKRAFIGTIFNLKVFRLKRTFKQVEAEMLEAEQEGRLIDYINSPKQQRFYEDMIDNSHRFLKTKNMKRVVELWHLRNRLMAERVLEAVERTGAKRVLVTFGAFHVPFVKKYLEEVEGVKVISYDQLSESEMLVKTSK